MEKYSPKVSVIIPVYNVEDYLSQCLDSIINQTLREIEIICVNDGSTDSSLEILNEFAIKDSRIIIVNQANAGAGAARNVGIKIAKGEYLAFLDSDDFFEIDMLEKAYNACKINQLDFVVFRSDIYDNDSNKYIPNYSTIRTDLLPRKKVFSYQDIKKDVFRVFVGWPWDKLYSRDFVISNNLTFQEQRTTNDLLFVFTALIKARRIMVIDDVLAHHRIRPGSSLSTTREKSWKCFYNALLALRDELKSLGIYEELEQSFVNYALHFSLWNLNTIDDTVYRELYNHLMTEIFHELGITNRNKRYFWHREEYKQYLEILKSENPVNKEKPNKNRAIKGLVRSIRNNGVKYVIYKIKYEFLKNKHNI